MSMFVKKISEQNKVFFSVYVRHTEEISANANITHVCFFHSISYHSFICLHLLFYFLLFLSLFRSQKNNKIPLLPASFRNAKEIKAKNTKLKR